MNTTVQSFLEAISIYDASELQVRDVIERGLLPHAGTFKGKYATAQRAADAVVQQVGAVRKRAIREGFRHIRDHVEADQILDHPLAAWAHALAHAELSKIDTTIKTGLRNGFDSAQIAAMVIGTVRHNGRDGITEQTRKHVLTLAHAHTKKEMVS